MPIRINLLAEEQAAEEMRRRDPIKRALFAGAALVLLMIVWIGLTQINIRAARSELADYEWRLSKLDDSSKEVRNNQALLGDIQSKTAALDKYATNRFFWGTFLDAIQHAAVENVRLVDIKADQKYTSGASSKFFTTNLTINYTPPPPRWKFWAASEKQLPILTLASNALGTITNGVQFKTNSIPYTTRLSVTATNASRGQVTVKAEFSNIAWAREEIVLEIRGRDYGGQPGAAIDEFTRRITDLAFFKDRLPEGGGLRFTERPPQPRPDPQDSTNPNALFVPFTIELRLKERVLTNE